MESVQRSAEKRPVAFAVAATIAFIGLDIVCARLASGHGLGWLAFKLTSKLLPAAAGFFLLWKFGWASEAGFRRPFPGTLHLAWLPAAAALLKVLKLAAHS